jgi:hypothetical protein
VIDPETPAYHGVEQITAIQEVASKGMERFYEEIGFSS